MTAEPLRVLHVNPGNLYGGVERILVMLARAPEFCPELEQHFAYCFEGRFAEEVRRHASPCHELGPVRLRSPLAVWKARRRLKAVLREVKPKVVVFHSAWGVAVFGALPRRAGAAMVQWLHGATEGRQLVERLARRTPPARIVAVSRASAATADRLYRGVPVDVWHPPLTVDPAAFDTIDRDAVRRQMGVAPRDLVVIQVSRMERGKGHREHLAALARLKELPMWQCWFVGGAERPEEASYMASLGEDARRLGIDDRVRFLGNRSDVPSLLVAADVFCQPNVGPEGFGIVFTEAFLARRPVVTSAIGGALEIVDDSCGILVPPRDVAAIAAALRRLMTEPELRRKLGTAGRARALARFDPSTQLRLLLEVLRRARAGA